MCSDTSATSVRVNLRLFQYEGTKSELCQADTSVLPSIYTDRQGISV